MAELAILKERFLIMEFITLERSSDDKIMPLTKQQVLAICHRGLGQDVQIESVQELAGGTFNTTYLVKLKDKSKLILRVGPSPTSDLYWDEVALMRREHHIRPFFASIATLMPQVMMADFTHQLIDRDYMFQSFIEGERWDEVEDDLTDDENLLLWEQLGSLMRIIHSTTGENFGWPYPGPQFKSWRELVINHLHRIGKSMQQEHLDITDFTAIVDLVQPHPLFLDEIQHPCLLHGDLWLFNILIRQAEKGPEIVGILDADRAWWGDPMADWLMFSLSVRRNEPAWEKPQAVFWAAYGRGAQSKADLFREEVYKAMHLGSVSIWCLKNKDGDGLTRAGQELRKIVEILPELIR
jgi:aminoglycoside phosphotransferase (APT) family kinase protein